MSTPALAYIRVSSSGQINGDGLTRQMASIQKYASASGLTITKTFDDAGVSGTVEGCDRPGLAGLFEHLKATDIRTVICERSDRLARDLLVGEVILAEFRKLNVAVIAAESAENLTLHQSPDRILIRQILGCLAQFDKNSIVSKLKSARDRKSAAMGRRCEGQKPLGWIPEEKPVVERILSLYRKPKNQPRRSYAAIADQLNTEGIRPRKASQWTPSTVYRVVQRAA